MWAMRIDDAAFTIQFFWRQFKGLGEATSGAPAPAPIIMLPACCGSDSSESSPELVIADGSADEFVSFPAGGTEASGNDLDDDGCMDCGMSWFVRFVPGSGNASVHCVADVGHIERTASDIIVPFGEDEATARASATAMSTAQAHAPSQALTPVAPASPSDFSGYLPFVGSPEVPNAPSGASVRARVEPHTPQFGLPLKSMADTPARPAERLPAVASGRTPRAALLSDPSLSRSKLPMRGAEVMAHDMATITAPGPANAQSHRDTVPPTDDVASPRGSFSAAVAPSGGGDASWGRMLPTFQSLSLHLQAAEQQAWSNSLPSPQRHSNPPCCTYRCLQIPTNPLQNPAALRWTTPTGYSNDLGHVWGPSRLSPTNL